MTCPSMRAVCLAAALGALLGWCVAVAVAAAPEGGFLADKHQRAGMNCAACHAETPPKTPVEMPACLQCHGPYEKLAEASQRLEKNPHQSHEGEVPCGDCHHAHKPSVDYCAKCHQFGFKVP